MFGQLSKNIINLFIIHTKDLSPYSKLEYFCFLDEEELHVYNSYKVEFKKTEFLIGRVLVKTALSYYIETKPENIRFVKNKYGKLYLNDSILYKTRDPIYFNVSHSYNMIVCAFSLGSEIGIDIERVGGSIDDISERFFTPEEKQYLCSYKQECKDDITYKIWTLKEAYIKAKGKGLSIPLESFDITKLDKEMFFYSIMFECDPRYHLSIAVDNKKGINYKIKIIRVNSISDLANNFNA